MHIVSSLKTTVVFATFALVLASLPMASPSNIAAATSAPSCAGPLHYKAQQGLMPPACDEDPNALTIAGGTSQFTLLGDPINTPTGSWPQVLVAANVAGGPEAEAAVFTDDYFDQPNDKMLHLMGREGNGYARLLRLPGGDSPEASVTLDANQDGFPDVVAALAGSNALALYLHSNALALYLHINAPQPLSDPILLDLEGAPDALAVGDFNGDLWADLAAISPQTGKIRFWRSSPQGLQPLALTLPYATEGYDALAVGDFNNDGLDDLTALRGAGYQTDSVVIFLQQGGGFPTSIMLSPQTGGYLPHSLAVGDIDNDGRDDLIVTAGGNVPASYLNIFLQGDNSLATTPTVADAWHLPSAIAIADSTHDGREDVVVVHDGWRTLSVYSQNADGSLAPYAVTTIPYSSRYRPHALALADFDGNGGLDVGLVGREAGFTVLHNTLAAPTATISSPLHAALLPSGPLTVTGNTSPGTTAVEVRIKGLTGWLPATLTGTTWQIDVNLPAQDRSWWIEARASVGTVVQAPPARHRVAVETVCYAIAERDSNSSLDVLIRFNRLSGVTTLINATGTRDIEAMAFQPGTGILFAVDRKQLGTIDLTSGAFTGSANPFGSGRGADGRVGFKNVDGLAFAADGTLYGVQRRSNDPDLLFQIDPASGRFVADAFGSGIDYVTITGPSQAKQIDDIAIDPKSGRLYGTADRDEDHASLVEINTKTGAATLIGPYGITDIDGLTFDSAGVLYGVTGNGSDEATTRSHIYTIDLASGHATSVTTLDRMADYEAAACRGLPVTPNTAPKITHFAVDTNGMNVVGPITTVSLAANTTNTIEDVQIAAYSYNQTAGEWVTAPSAPWQPYHSDSSNYNVALATDAGVTYLQALVRDQDGQITTLPAQTFVNVVPGTDTLPEAAGRVYRYPVRQGQRLTVDVESIEGNADLVVWPPDDEVLPSPWISNQPTGTDTMSVVAAESGIYQIEVRAASPATYRLTVTIADETSALTEATSASPAELSTLQPLIPLDSTPAMRRGQVSLSPAQSVIYLPYVQR